MLKNITTRIVTFAVILTFFFITGLPTESSAYYPSNYVKSDEVPAQTVYDLVQTEDGYIWIASYEGLARYDGTSSYVFTEKDGMPSMKINDLFIDSNGNLWIATHDAGLVLYQDEEFIVIDTINGLSHNMVRDIEEDSQGNIIIATQGGISVVSEDLEVTNHTNSTLDEDYPIDLITTENDEVFAVTNDGKILKANGSDISGTMEIIYSPSETNVQRATATFLSDDGSVYFGFSDGQVKKYTNGQTTTYTSSSISSIVSFYEYDDIIYLCGGGGLGVIYNDEIVMIEGLELDSVINAVLKDYEGNYWIGSSRDGILKLVPSTYTDVSSALGLPELTVNSTAVFNDDLYIGADAGLVIVDGDTKQMVSNDATALLDGVRIRNLCVIDNQLWISTYSSSLGVVILDASGSYEMINTSNSDLPSDDIRFSIPLQNNQVFVGTKNGAAILENNEVIAVYDMSNGLENAFILSACQTSDGTIYVGTDGGGAYTISPDGVVSKIENDTELNTDIVLRLETDPITDNVWLSTNTGLAYIDADGIHPVSEITEENLTAFDIKFYKNDIWLICSDGIYTFDRIAYQNGESIALDKLGEANFSITPNSWSGVYQNTIFLSTTDGVYAINMDTYYENSTVPKISKPEITVDGEPIPIVNGVVTIPSHAERITISASTLSSSSDSGYQMTIKMNGFDTQEVVFDSKQAEVSYTNVPGGSYEFVITATNQFGVEAVPVHIQVEKEYALYEYQVVQIFTIGILFAIIMIIMNLIQKRLNKVKSEREKEYRLITEQSIEAIANAIDAKDPYTRGHSNRVAEYSNEIGIALGMTKREADSLYFAGLLHDIGKIGVEGRILSKEGRLTDEEFAAIKEHCNIGYDILKGITAVDNISVGARYHHERYDGKGYPAGLVGEEIPLFARIICVADAYDAMTSTRPYRVGMDPKVARDELVRSKGTQFDPEIVDVMISYIDNKIIKK